MTGLPYYVVDVFAETKYAGNPLAVFVLNRALDPSQMQQIAKEINYSETTFITHTHPRQGGYDVRIFTPAQELPFAGHPTLGTAYILQQKVVDQPVAQITLNLAVGQIPVTLNYGNGGDGAPEYLWMEQKAPTFGRSLSVEAVADVLGLDPEAFDARFPLEEVSTGVPFLMAPLRTLAALQQIQVNRDRYFQLIENLDAKAILAFCPETRSADNQLSARMFGEALGVIEDPATGSANGCLAGYLVKHRYFGGDRISVRVEQGYEIGRPSLLLLEAEGGADPIRVSVGGRVILVARGEFL